MYKVVLIVDFTPFAFSLTRFIGKTLQIQKVFVSIEEALVPTEDDKHNPDFIIINLSEINLTTEVFNHLKGNYPNASIILISKNLTQNSIVNIISQGVTGLYHEEDDVFFTDKFINTLIHVKLIGCHISRLFVTHLFDYINHSNMNVVTKNLTKRQNQIVDLLMKGHSYQSIADQLELSINTIRKHISILYKKLDINDKTGLFNLKNNTNIKLSA
jgi:DNA-binding NarL/FixJ family response regulator